MSHGDESAADGVTRDGRTRFVVYHYVAAGIVKEAHEAEKER